MLRFRPFSFALALVSASIIATPAAGQRVEEIPNAMSSHTIFIIIVTGAFLAWAASFSFHTVRERASRNNDRRLLISERERILDDLARVEAGRDSGEIDEIRYKRRLKALRGDLARVVERLQSMSRAKKKHA